MLCATGAGSASPVVSITTVSNLSRCSISWKKLRTRSPRTVQQTQPLFICTTSWSEASSRWWSIPTSPNSLTMTATRRPCSAVRMRLSSVVLPEPRKPVRMMTEALEAGFVEADVIAAWKVGSTDATCKAATTLSSRRRRSEDRSLHLADHPADRLAVLHLHVAAHDGVDRQAFDLPAAPRRRMILAVQLLRIDGRLLVHVDDGEIAIGAEPDRALLGIHLPDLGDVLALHLDVVVERHAAFVHLREKQRNVGLDAAETGDTVPDRGLHHLAVDVAALLLERVRRVVGRNHVDRAIQQPLPQRVLVLLAADRRVHLQKRSGVLHVGVDPQQVVGLCFRGEAQATRLAVADHLHRLLGRGVDDMQLGAEGLGQEHDVGDGLRLAEPRPRRLPIDRVLT